MTARIKVKRAALLKVVDGRVRKAEAEHKRAKESHPERVRSWESACAAQLRKALASAERGKVPVDRYGNHRVEFPPKPAAPREGRELCQLRRLRETLAMGADETLTISPDDADTYFGPCKV